MVRREVLFHLSWSRAHQTEQQMSVGTISYRDWVGNNWADLTAKKGAGRDALDPRTVSNYFKELAAVVGWMRWCIWVHQCCCEDRSWADENFGKAPYVPRGTQLLVTAHDFRPVRGREGMYFCVGCRMLTAGVSCMQRNLSRSCFPFGGWGWTAQSATHHIS